MNLKKFNIYKNALYFDIASGLLLVAGLIIGLILGLNSIMTFQTSAILKTVIAVLIFMLIVFVYGFRRYDVYTGFTMVMGISFNVMLTTAMVCIFRMPVDESLMMVMLVVCTISAFNLFILFANKKEFKKTDNREKLVNELVCSKFKTLVLMNCTFVAVLILLIFTFDASILMFIRPMLVGIVVCLYSSIFMVAPFWGYFVKEKQAKKQVSETEVDYIK